MAVWDDDEVVLLAHLLGDGSLRRAGSRSATPASTRRTWRAVTEAARDVRHHRRRGTSTPPLVCTTLRLPAPFRLTHGRRNPIAAWLDELGLFGLPQPREVRARVGLPPAQGPDRACSSGTSGPPTARVTVNQDGRGGRVYYASTSRRLVDDVARLLLRFGISTRIRAGPQGRLPRRLARSTSTAPTTSCASSDEIGVHGARGEQAAALLDDRCGPSGRTPTSTPFPAEVWDRVREVLAEQGMTHRELRRGDGHAVLRHRRCGSTPRAASGWPGRRACSTTPSSTCSPPTTSSGTRSSSIEPVGEEQVFDATVLGTPQLRRRTGSPSTTRSSRTPTW